MISFELEGGEDFERVQLVLEELAGRVEGGLGADYAGPAISAEIAKLGREWFDTEGQGTWPPLAPSTVRDRLRQGYGGAHPILQRTKRLYYSISDPRGRGSADAVVIMQPSNLEQGTLVPYARYHMGGPRMPRRVPIPHGEDVYQRLRDVYEDYVLETGR